MKKLGLSHLVVGLFVGVVDAFVYGYALSVLWGWFVAPIFDVPRIPVAPATGTMLIVRYLLRYHESKYNEEESFIDQAIEGFSTALAPPLTALALGWIVHLFI